MGRVRVVHMGIREPWVLVATTEDLAGLTEDLVDSAEVEGMAGLAEVLVSRERTDNPETTVPSAGRVLTAFLADKVCPALAVRLELQGTLEPLERLEVGEFRGIRERPGSREVRVARAMFRWAGFPLPGVVGGSVVVQGVVVAVALVVLVGFPGLGVTLRVLVVVEETVVPEEVLVSGVYLTPMLRRAATWAGMVILASPALPVSPVLPG